MKIIKEYGHIKMSFDNYYKGLFTYKSHNNKYLISGYIDENGNLEKEETVNDLYQTLDKIEFKFIK